MRMRATGMSCPRACVCAVRITTTSVVRGSGTTCQSCHKARIVVNGTHGCIIRANFDEQHFFDNYYKIYITFFCCFSGGA